MNRTTGAFGLDVSHETLRRLERFVETLEKWNKAINLISPSQIPEIWKRHILDSAQLLDYAPTTARHWVDLGSGGGFPGLVVAILATELRPELRFTLVESDTRKASFLRYASEKIPSEIEVVNERIENLEPIQADVLSARALAPLEDLLAYCTLHLRSGGVALFPKGRRFQEELNHALAKWRFSLQKLTSKTSPESVILRVQGVSRA